jgi:hypothetical protein
MADTGRYRESSSEQYDKSKVSDLPIALSKDSCLLLNLKAAIDKIGYSPSRNAADEKRIFLKFCQAEDQDSTSRMEAGESSADEQDSSGRAFSCGIEKSDTVASLLKSRPQDFRGSTPNRSPAIHRSQCCILTRNVSNTEIILFCSVLGFMSCPGPEWENALQAIRTMRCFLANKKCLLLHRKS